MFHYLICSVTSEKGELHNGRLIKAFKSLAKTLRPRTFLLFLVISPFGSIVASLGNLTDGIISMMFSGFISAFGLVLNDVEDAELDARAWKYRNPVAFGELSRRSGYLIALTFLLLSISMTPFLNSYNKILGVIVIFLFYSYSSGIRVKSKPILDIAYHGLCLAIFAVMGYLSQRPPDIPCFLFSAVIFFLSCVSQTLQEIRDWEFDRKGIETTVTKLGRKNSLILCLVFFSIVYGLFATAFLVGILPFEYLLLSPLTYFVVSPVVKTIRDMKYLDDTIRLINNRVPILTVVLIVGFLLIRSSLLFQWISSVAPRCFHQS